MDHQEAVCLARARGRAYVRALAIARFGAKPDLDRRMQEVENAVLALNIRLAEECPEVDE